jgi:hypothetical protein
MRNRKEPETEIARRLMRVPMELEYAPEADYIVINDDLEHAAAMLATIVSAERSRPSRQPAEARLEYTFVAQVVPLCGSEALARETGTQFPETVINEGESPHTAAERALKKAFGVALPAGTFVYGGEPNDDFAPPVALQTSAAAEDDRIMFVYPYRMVERIDPPPGWVWTPLPSNLLPAAEWSEA